jgi:hypothetical protein
LLQKILWLDNEMVLAGCARVDVELSGFDPLSVLGPTLGA